MRWKRLPGLLIVFLSIAAFANAQFTAVVINNGNDNSNEPSTQAPSDSPVTGKLSQFKGFHTPRPIPANAVYSTHWASWSAWSFCTGKVQVRVRACNTVRGYSCQGPNRETKPCDIPPPKLDDENQQDKHTDYDAHDSFEADRREALKQLNIETDLAAKQKPPTQEFRRQLSAGKTHLQEPQGPPANPIGRQSGPGIAHAPSMTPELLYERKHFVDTDVPLKKAAAFASKNTKQTPNIVDKSITRDNEVTTKQVSQTTKQPSTLDKDTKTKPLNSKLRDSQSVSSSVLIGNSQQPNQWNNSPSNQSPRLSNRQPFTRPPFDPTTQRFKPTTSRFVPLPTATAKSPQQQIGRGDEVKITSSVQQHFKEASLTNGVSSSINEVKFRDSNSSNVPQVQAHIQEEPLATALEPDQPNTSDAAQEAPKPEPNENIPNTITPPPRSKSVVAQKPTEEEVERMARRFEKTRLSGEAGQLKDKLHSGEIVHDKLPAMNDETAKALEWMLQNMTDATQPVAKPAELHNLNLDNTPVSVQEGRRAFASKILPEIRISKHQTVRSQSRVPNPDEEGKQLESELVALKESMRQMETELKELREAENESQEPKFNIRKAINLNLVPNVPPKFRTPALEAPKIADKPSELFLLDHFQHKSSAHWSEWSQFGECFCNKRIRTRNCIYDDPAHSEGCEGKSYESIRCVGGRPCPAQRKNLAIARRISNPTKSSTIVGHFHPSTSRFYTVASSLAETTEQPPHGDLFYPNPLPMSRRQF